MRRLHLVVLLLGLLTTGTEAQHPRFPFPLEIPLPGVTGYRSDIPTPEAIIGHQIGTRHTEPAQIIDYFKAVAAVSDRVQLGYHGKTYENRPLIHAFVSSPANIQRLETIRQQNLRLSEEPESVSDEELRTMPVVVYQGFSIHGNEASGSEAALLELYYLAAAEGPFIDSLLNQVIIILDPSFNPDGRARFTTYVNQNRGGVPVGDPQDREHREPWPGGRTNHYWFDLNRDWLPGQHPESQGRLKLFHAWRPQLLTDHHEMGAEATFFFQPGIPSRNNPNTPPRTYKLTAELATYHARYLDRIGSLYYTKESFDDFYYGKGSTYPDINGAVGILFEQASSRALLRETSSGVLSYAFTVRNHFMTALSTIEGAFRMREKFLRHQRDFYASALDFARQQPVKGYVVDVATYPVRASFFTQLLKRHRIRFYQLAQDVRIGNDTFEQGKALIIPMAQRQARLIKAIMERVTTFQDSLFYDVSAWTTPLAFGLRYGELTRNPSPLMGQELQELPLPEGKVVGETKPYVYLIPWGSYFAPRAVYQLQRAGRHPRVLFKPFTLSIAGKTVHFDAGTIAVPVVERDTTQSMDTATFHRFMERIARENHLTIYAAGTGLVSQGPDIGSRTAAVIPMPSIAILTGPGTSTYDVGEVRHLLNERMHIPLSLLDADFLPRADLSRYNTLVVAGGFFGSNGEQVAQRLKHWVQKGGLLVVTEEAMAWAIRQGLLEETLRDPEEPDLRNIPYIELPAARGAYRIGGSIFEITLDTTHPIAFGMPERMPVFRASETFYEPSGTPGATVARYTEEPLLSGYIHPSMKDELAGSASILARRSGRGHIVGFADNPNFRAFWYGTNGLFLNALFFGHVF